MMSYESLSFQIGEDSFFFEDLQDFKVILILWIILFYFKIQRHNEQLYKLHGDNKVVPSRILRVLPMCNVYVLYVGSIII